MLWPSMVEVVRTISVMTNANAAPSTSQVSYTTISASGIRNSDGSLKAMKLAQMEANKSEKLKNERSLCWRMAALRMLVESTVTGVNTAKDSVVVSHQDWKLLKKSAPVPR